MNFSIHFDIIQQDIFKMVDDGNIQYYDLAK